MRLASSHTNGQQIAGRVKLALLISLLVVTVSACASSVNTESEAAMPTLTPVPETQPGILYVDAGQTLGEISPLVYGSNYGPWLFVTLDVRPIAVDAKLGYLRFPGGNWGDLNDLDEWSIDQYIALCGELGTEPAISVRLRGGSVEHALHVLRYVNIEKQYGVRYWSIGNEPSLYPDYDTERFNEEWRIFATQMKELDPTILLVGPDTHQFTADLENNPKDENGKDWLVEFLKANGDLVDVVAIHRYPFPIGKNGGPPTVDDLRGASAEWDEIIPAMRALIREHAGRDIPVGVTEVNSSWASTSGGEATLDSHFNAIWWADSLGRMIRQGTDIVAQFCLVGEYGLMNKYDPLPIYNVYQMYQRFGTQLVYAASDRSDLSVFAAKREDGALTVMVVNLGDGETSYPLQIDGMEDCDVEVWRFDAQSAAENFGTMHFVNMQELSVPGQSINLYVFDCP